MIKNWQYFILLISLILNINECKRINKRAAVGPKWPTNRIPYAFSNIYDFDIKSRKIIEDLLKETQSILSINGN